MNSVRSIRATLLPVLGLMLLLVAGKTTANGLIRSVVPTLGRSHRVVDT